MNGGGHHVVPDDSSAPTEEEVDHMAGTGKIKGTRGIRAERQKKKNGQESLKVAVTQKLLLL
jgi:hypothetical protein